MNFVTLMLASLSISFDNTNFKLGEAFLKPVRATDYVLCTKNFLLRNFVPHKEGLRISKLILFSTVKVKL